MNKKFIKNEVLIHTDTLLQYANKFTKDQEEAEDLVQETLIKVLKYQDSFEMNTNLLGWIYTIMKNIFINGCRKKVLEKNYLSKVQSIGETLKQQSNNKCLDNFMREDLNLVLRSIPEKHYIPFMMFFEGYKYYEIADHLGLPEGTIKTRIHTARKLLKQRLKSYRQT